MDKKLEKMYDQVNQLENPLTPQQVVLLRKVVNKFKSKVEQTEDKEENISKTIPGPHFQRRAQLW